MDLDTISFTLIILTSLYLVYSIIKLPKEVEKCCQDLVYDYKKRVTQNASFVVYSPKPSYIYVRRGLVRKSIN